MQTGFLHGSSDLEIRDPMATSEIEKLERRYAENPQGLTFAPLAEVHRKNGDVARALELLRAGWNFIPTTSPPASCSAAAIGTWATFRQPSRHLPMCFGWTMRMSSRSSLWPISMNGWSAAGEAQRWLHRLISVDRSNEEAREQLSRLEAAKETRPPAGAARRAADCRQSSP